MRNRRPVTRTLRHWRLLLSVVEDFALRPQILGEGVMTAFLQPREAFVHLDIQALGKWEMNASYLVAMSLRLILLYSVPSQNGRDDSCG